LKEIADDIDQANSIRNMALALLTMHEWFGEETQGMEEGAVQEYLKGFFNYLGNRVLALYLATPDNLDDAYNLFTVLNSRGMQLQVSDILRAQNLRSIDDEKLRRSYAEKWEQFQNTIDAPFSAFDDFLWALVFIKMKYRSEANKSLQKAFDYMFASKMLEKGPATFDFVGKYSGHYDKLASGSVQVPAEAGRVLHNLHILLSKLYGNTYMAPLMHYRETFGDHRITEFMIKLDNLLSAAWLVGKRSGQTRNFIMLRRMEEILGTTFNAGGDRMQAADEFLNSDCLRYDYRDEQANTFMDIQELYDLFNEEKWGGYAGTRINKTRYIFLKLDLILSNTNTQIQFDRGNSSLEHLMPQKLNQHWTASPDEHKEWVHRLGNIVLIDGKKNSSLSNRSYTDKKEIYLKGIENRPNTNHVLMHQGNWTIDGIKANHERILALLRTYYEGNSLETLLAMKKSAGKVKGPAQQQLL